jgi:hypothetical protein
MHVRIEQRSSGEEFCSRRVDMFWSVVAKFWAMFRVVATYQHAQSTRGSTCLLVQSANSRLCRHVQTSVLGVSRPSLAPLMITTPPACATRQLLTNQVSPLDSAAKQVVVVGIYHLGATRIYRLRTPQPRCLRSRAVSSWPSSQASRAWQQVILVSNLCRDLLLR